MIYNYFLEYWSPDSRQILIKLLISYIKFSFSVLSKKHKNETIYTLDKFSEKFGHEMGKLMKEVKMKNIWNLKNLEFEKEFEKHSFLLSD